MDDPRNLYPGTNRVNSDARNANGYPTMRGKTPDPTARSNSATQRQQRVNSKSISYSDVSASSAKTKKKNEAKRKMILKNTRNLLLILVLVIVSSIAIATVTISCINDVFAVNSIGKSEDIEKISVVISDNMSTDDVINALHDVGLIKNGWFCKLAAKFIGYTDDGYIPRTYELSRSMGLENMLNEIKNNTSKTAKTITLTFPEGYSADQILDMLDENNVCSRDKLIKEMQDTDFSESFDFLVTRTSKEQRYIDLEGYLFPDTYDFYIGESANSVIKKFLNNFKNKWTDNFVSLSEEKGLSIDEVVILASIVAKEAVGDDMYTVASILFNRIDANMRLECDSTSNYIPYSTGDLSDADKVKYNEIYDTYICSSLPIGPICNPGSDAIDAVLCASKTDYYYFIHDANNVFHAARNLSEQEANIANYGLAGQ